MRLKKSIINLFAAFGGQMVMIILKFVMRRYISLYLGIDFLGVEGVISNLVDLIGIIELGIGGVVGYELYKPIAENNTAEVKALVNLYAFIYRGLGILVLIIGGMMTPFITLLSPELVGIANIHLLFLFFVLGNAITYFFTYLYVLVSAYQETYVYYFNYFAWRIVLRIVQLWIIKATGNYLWYAGAVAIEALVEGIVFVFISKCKYPVLNNRKGFRVEQSVIGRLLHEIKNVAVGRIGQRFIEATDSLIITGISGLTQTGLYGNYVVVVAGLRAVTSEVMYAITASVGNFMVEKGAEDRRSLFFITLFVNSMIVSISSVCLYVLIQPFIIVWLGEEYLLSTEIVVLFVLSYYIGGIRQHINTFRYANGLFDIEAKKSIVEAGVNVFLSLVLTNIWGMTGCIVGTVLSSIAIGYRMELKNILVFLEVPIKKYVAKSCLYAIYTVVCICACERLLCGMGVASFLVLVKLIIGCLLICGGFGLLFVPCKECRYCLHRIKSLFGKMRE